MSSIIQIDRKSDCFMATVERIGSRPQPDNPGRFFNSDMPAPGRRSRPGASLTIQEEQLAHTNRVRRVAYMLHETLVLTAERERLDGGWYTTALLQQVPPDERARRDWLLAESIVGQGNPTVVQSVEDRHRALVETSVGKIAEVAYILYETRVLSRTRGRLPESPTMSEEALRQQDWDTTRELVERRDPAVLQPIFDTHNELLALAA